MWTHSSGGKTLPFIQESRLVSIKLVLEIFNAPLCIICKIFSPVPPCDRTGFCKGHRQINFLTRTTACANYAVSPWENKKFLYINGWEKYDTLDFIFLGWDIVPAEGQSGTEAHTHLADFQAAWQISLHYYVDLLYSRRIFPHSEWMQVLMKIAKPLWKIWAS